MAGMQVGENFSQAGLANNQLTGFSYDAAGNTTSDGTNGYTYDGENRIVSAAGVTYTYDGDGERVKKSNGRLYWFGRLAESDLSGNLTAEYIVAGGQRLARRDLPSGTVHYYFSDHLRSVSLVTNASGAIEEESDYYPWGGERVITHTLTDQHYKFNGKERDSETGFDDFGARFYSNTWGRWLTPDWSADPTPVPYAQLDNPQSLNLYAYVRNNPTTFPDLDGHLAAGGAIYGVGPNAFGDCGFSCEAGSGEALKHPHRNCFPGIGCYIAGGPKKIDKKKAAAHLEKHAVKPRKDPKTGKMKYGTGWCAQHCQDAIAAGGGSMSGRPGYAKDAGAYLMQNGAVPENTLWIVDGMLTPLTLPSSWQYSPQLMDTAVFQPTDEEIKQTEAENVKRRAEGKPEIQAAGHEQSWTGPHWVSDFVQKDFQPNTSKPHDNFVIYRFPD